ncbi:phosphotransferase [Cryptosporangium phraense]|uniref:Aminoglycoside phosphotransferase family protein n=1 Tax=Cryptosporangium phraense TaxID=2593070 RepID=A0A545ARY7_9ACTN|nr:phosphotransferase [Cryptosporangium phraense]TQS44023.1 aminoglycoside phosphotransferase family protein [Cryptosporangium phraense]
MLTPPRDLSEPTLRAALRTGWGVTPVTLAYRPVGFGSHHWEAAGADGVRLFVTVDDLRTRRMRTGEPLDLAYDRLRAALSAARALRAAGRDFVVAPQPSSDGGPLTRAGDPFAVAVYPFVDGERFDWGPFTPAHRDAVLDLLVQVHRAPPEVRALARTDDFAIPFRDAVTAPIDPDAGPYARASADLLTTHADGIRRAFARYDALVEPARDAGTVLTHGEPHPGNTMRTDQWLLIDWDTALAAPPERDLWNLEPLHPAYAAATGTVLRPELLDLYRLRWDLAEIAVCTARFRDPHGDTDDDRETWSILAETVPRMS